MVVRVLLRNSKYNINMRIKGSHTGRPEILLGMKCHFVNPKFQRHLHQGKISEEIILTMEIPQHTEAVEGIDHPSH